MALREVVHAAGVVCFASLPGDAYDFRVDYEQAQGRVWLKSSRTEREWCVFDQRVSVSQSVDLGLTLPSYRSQAPRHRQPRGVRRGPDIPRPVHRRDYALRGACVYRQQTNSMDRANADTHARSRQLALQYDPRVHKTDACKNVVLSRARDDLVLQLSQRVYTRRNPAWGPPIQFTLEWVRGSGTLPHGMSRDPPTPLPLPEPPRSKVPREEQQKDTIARLREENKALKAAKRDRAGDSRLYKAENEALRREVQQLKAANDAQYAELIKLGGSHEFQRQHIEHLRRKIQGLQQQLATAGQQQQPLTHHHHPHPPTPRSDSGMVSVIAETESEPLMVQVAETDPELAELEPRSLDQDIRSTISDADAVRLSVSTLLRGEQNKRRRTSAD